MHVGDWVTLIAALLFIGFVAYLPNREKVQRRKQTPRTHSNAVGEQKHDQAAFIQYGGLGSPGNDR